MKLNTKLKNRVIIIALLSIVVYLLCAYFFNTSRQGFENKSDIQLVISRYAEKLNWLNDEVFNRYPNIIYNKGSNDDYTTNANTISTVNVENVGRCDHTYLYHIINNYDNLANITVFLPGSLDMQHKYEKAKRILEETEQNGNPVWIGFMHDSVKTDMYGFQLDDWQASQEINKSANPETKLELSEERPFGKWMDKNFPGVDATKISYWGMFCVSREEVLQHPKQYYSDLIKQLETSSNPEVGHYFERGWEAVFHTLSPKTKFIQNIE
jgi:hypothetical protein